MGIWDTLKLDPDRHRMVALVGGGGKSSTMYALARQAADGGKTVVVTTTTHILPHPKLPLTGDRSYRGYNRRSADTGQRCNA